MKKRSERQMLVVFLLAAIVVIPLGIWIFGTAPPRVPQEPATADGQWQAALSNGNGDVAERPGQNDAVPRGG